MAGENTAFLEGVRAIGGLDTQKEPVAGAGKATAGALWAGAPAVAGSIIYGEASHTKMPLQGANAA